MSGTSTAVRFWKAFQACVEENRVGPDQSIYYVRWVQEFPRFMSKKQLSERTLRLFSEICT